MWIDEEAIPVVSNMWSDLIHDQEVWRSIYILLSNISIITWVYVCVCNRSPGRVIWPNHEVKGLQPWSGITIALDFVAYWYVLIPRLLQYYSTLLRHHKSSSSQLGVVNIRTRISSLFTGSYSHLGVDRIHNRIFNSPPLYLCCYPIPCCMFLSPRKILLASCDISSKVVLSCVSSAYWCQHASPLSLPPSYSF